MPYFTRQPYAALQGVAAPPRPASDPPEDFLGLAASVLEAEAPAEEIQTLRLRAPLKPGQTGTLLIEIFHDGGPGKITSGLVADRLTGPGGAGIAADNIGLHPDLVMLSPGQSAEVTVTVSIPAGTPAGAYRGLLRSEIEDGFDLRLEVTVVA